MVEEVSMKSAVFWTAIAKYSTAALQLIFAAILSRLLTPEQFGIVAIINVFVVFFQLFCDMGFGTAVIQDKSIPQKYTNDIFSWSLYFGLGLMVLFIGVSYPISIFYEDSIYIPLGVILSLALFLNAFNMIPNAIMLKEKRFKSIAYRTIISGIVSSLLTIALAFKGYGVYALVMQSVFSSLFILIWNLKSVRLCFNYKPGIASIKRIWSYSMYQFLSQLINFFNRNLDSLLIGKIFPKSDLGQYNKSYHLMQLPIAYIPGVVGPALHPILSEHQDNPKYIYTTYLRILKILSLIGCLISVWLYYIGEELIIILFGSQWYPAILPFRILALSVWFQLLTNTIAPIYQSIGNTKLMFKSIVYTCIVMISLIIMGCLMRNIVYVATCVAIAYFLNFFLTYFIIVKYGFKESFTSFLFTFWQDFLIYLIMISVTIIPIDINNYVVSVVFKSFLILLIYITLLRLTRQYNTLWSLIKINKI